MKIFLAEWGKSFWPCFTFVTQSWRQPLAFTLPGTVHRKTSPDHKANSPDLYLVIYIYIYICMLENFSPQSNFTSILWVLLDGTGWDVSNSESCFCEYYHHYCLYSLQSVYSKFKQACVLYWLFSFNGKSKHFVYEMMYDTFGYEHGVWCSQWKLWQNAMDRKEMSWVEKWTI